MQDTEQTDETGIDLKKNQQAKLDLKHYKTVADNDL